MVIYKDDKIEISIQNKEVYINYYDAGVWRGETKSEDLYDFEAATFGHLTR